jgi:hypothetical protein
VLGSQISLDMAGKLVKCRLDFCRASKHSSPASRRFMQHWRTSDTVGQPGLGVQKVLSDPRSLLASANCELPASEHVVQPGRALGSLSVGFPQAGLTTADYDEKYVYVFTSCPHVGVNKPGTVDRPMAGAHQHTAMATESGTVLSVSGSPGPRTRVFGGFQKEKARGSPIWDEPDPSSA